MISHSRFFLSLSLLSLIFLSSLPPFFFPFLLPSSIPVYFPFPQWKLLLILNDNTDERMLLMGFVGRQKRWQINRSTEIVRYLRLFLILSKNPLFYPLVIDLKTSSHQKYALPPQHMSFLVMWYCYAHSLVFQFCC